MAFIFADARQLWLEISPAMKMAARQVSSDILAPGARWQVYLNQLCTSACLEWIREEMTPAATVFPTLEVNPMSWEMVTGSCVNIGDVKLVVIPSDDLGQEELLVPQEWIDIPSWAADYYLAVKVNPDEGWAEGWGYATHHQIKTHGAYDTWARCYSLDAAELETDMGTLWPIVERCPNENVRADIQAESISEGALVGEQAEGLVTRLANSHVAFPRLSIPFAQWKALLADGALWQRLCQQRLAALQREVAGSQGASLSEVLQGVQSAIAAGWQSIESVFGTEAQQRAFGMRQVEQAEGRQAKDIPIGPDNQVVRLVLLWQLEPVDHRLAIRAQLYPGEGELYLPADITFSLLSAQDDVLQFIQSEEANNYIQLGRFKCHSGSTFGIEIKRGEQQIIEKFKT